MQIQNKAALSFTKIFLPSILMLLCSACTHASQKHLTSAQEIKSSENLQSYAWHDGSTGGAYGIGEGWSFEILPAEYKDVIETIHYGPSTSLDIIPAEYEWVKGTITGPNVVRSPRIKLHIIPGAFETVSETYIAKPTKPPFSLIPPEYNSEGDLVRKALIAEHEFVTQTATRKVRVLSFPERVSEELVSFEPREGYTLLEIKPAEVRNLPRPQQSITVTNWEEVRPMEVVIRNPNGDTVHNFNSVDFFAFLRSFE